jgi:acetyl esterase
VVLALVGDRRPVQRDGRVLNRSTQAMLALTQRFDTRPSSPSATPPDPTTLRDQLRRSARVAMPSRTDVYVTDRIVPGVDAGPDIPVRVYRQFGTGVGPGPGQRGRPPAIVYFHGGGWVIGDLDTHDGTCRLLAAASRCVVVAVDYRLAPEHPFPAAVDDCLAAYAWVHHNAEELGIAAGRVGVMGDSAGGNLAAVVAQMTTRHPFEVPAPVAQGLVYPAVDSRLDTGSLRSVGEGFLLTRDTMEYFRRQYLPDGADWEDPRASPLLAEDLSGLAPALVVTAGFDPLRDDGINYAEALRKGGVTVEYRCFHDQIHGFMGMGILADSLALATEVCDAMGRLMHRPGGADRP